MKITLRKLILTVYIAFSSITLFAVEGMLLPSFIAAFADDMKAKGMRMSATDIYDINHASIKDAIIHFDGGCTAEIVSKRGLILTNHHCGFDEIQKHSSLKNDYLKFGFWAKNLNDELINPGLTATRIVRIEDMTGALKAYKGDRNQLLANMKTLCADAVRGTHFEAEIKAFDFGNAYYMMVKEVFKDVRLVGAPPSSVGKFGGDTDNWVWPRHTGDFSVFRIYAGKDNKPAMPSADNVPYTPLHSLPISMHNRKEKDFTLVYGFPGQTEQHTVSTQLDYIISTLRPMQINMRTKSLDIIGKAMRESDAVRIQYAAKQSGIANAWKKWIGQLNGLKQIDGAKVKLEYEKRYIAAAKNDQNWFQYSIALNEANALCAKAKNADFTYNLVVEYVFNGAEFLRIASSLNDFISFMDTAKNKIQIAEKLKQLNLGAEGFFKDYSPKVDRLIFDALTPAYKNYADGATMAALIAQNSQDVLSKNIYEKSILTDKKRYLAFINSYSPKKYKKLKKDQGYQLFKQIVEPFYANVLPLVQLNRATLQSYMAVFQEGKTVMNLGDKLWSDANSTLRISYGQLEGSKPYDAVEYTPFTYVEGIMEKNITGDPDFELLPSLMEAYTKQDWGQYAQDGRMLVCFTGSNHTTGGNSGSPVLNADGYLMGLNFDRSWESTMSDFIFNPNRCRNIVVDIHYVLWVMDKYAGAGYLVEEMDLRR